MYDKLSNMFAKVSGSQPFNSGICWVRQTKGPIAHNSESSNTDKDPDTAICPSCSRNLCPIAERASPNNVKCAPTSNGWTVVTAWFASSHSEVDASSNFLSSKMFGISKF